MRRGVPPSVAVTLLVLLAACEAQSGDLPPQAAAQSTTIWGLLGGWSGSGDRQTESFDITSGALRLNWEAGEELTPGEGRLRVALHSAISGRPLQTLVDVSGMGADSVRFAATPRVAYLLIESSGLEWHLELEEGVVVESGIDRGPGQPDRAQRP